MSLRFGENATADNTHDREGVPDNVISMEDVIAARQRAAAEITEALNTVPDYWIEYDPDTLILRGNN